MKARAIRNNLIVELIPVKPKEVGGILIGNFSKDHRRMDCGKVLYVSNKTKENGKVNIGDKVIFGKLSGVNVQIEDKRLLWLTEREVLMVLEEDEDVEVIASHDLEGEIIRNEQYSEWALTQTLGWT